MQFSRFEVKFQYPSRCNVVVLDIASAPFLARELEHLGVTNYVPSSRIVIARPKFLFWLAVYLFRTSRIAANLAAFIRSSRIPICACMDFLDVQLPAEDLEVSLLEEVSRIVPGCQFVSIQHGQELRRFATRGALKPLKRVTLLCFGSWAAENFPKFGRREYRYLPVGALVNSLYVRTRPRRISRDCQLVIISTVKDDSWWGPQTSERKAGYECLMRFVGDFCSENTVKPLVALTIDRDTNTSTDETRLERQWFINRLGEEIDFTEPSLIFGGRSGLDEQRIAPQSVRERFSSYFASDQSEVTIGMSSTALWEAFARGNKILAVNMTENPIYDFPIDGIWSMRQPSYHEFAERLTQIMKLTEAEWENISELPRHHLIRNDKDESVSDRIRSYAESALARHPWRKQPAAI